MPVGDEHFHYFIDEKQNTYTLESTGYLKSVSEELLKTKQQTAIRKAMARAPRRAQQLNPLSGKKKTLVILVNFKDTKFSDELNNGNPKATFNAICNEHGYTNEWGAIGSVHDYFYDQSYGKFDLTFDVVGPVTVSRNYAYYGQQDSNGNNDANAPEMVREAINLVKDSVNFADYDWDGSKEAGQIICIYAGEGEATNTTGNTNLIWPHQYNLQYTDGGTMKINGITLNNYLVLNELVKNTYTYGSGISKRTVTEQYLDGMGTLCHEFSHSIGLMDHYDTGNASGSDGTNYGTGSWDLMDYGCYGGPNGNGWVPTSMTAYERMYLGWLTPTELYSNKDSITNMPYLQDSPDAYIIYNKAHSDEYFMLENKGNARWDSYLPQDGLLVTHIDYNNYAWAYNTVNSGDVQRMTIVPADGNTTRTWPLKDEYAEQGMTFPYYNKDYIDSEDFVLNNRARDRSYNLFCTVRGIKINDDGTINFGYVPDPRYATATGITSIKSNGSTATTLPVYNLAGQRVNDSYKGIIISGGKKYIAK